MLCIARPHSSLYHIAQQGETSVAADACQQSLSFFFTSIVSIDRICDTLQDFQPILGIVQCDDSRLLLVVNFYYKTLLLSCGYKQNIFE